MGGRRVGGRLREGAGCWGLRCRLRPLLNIAAFDGVPIHNLIEDGGWSNR